MTHFDEFDFFVLSEFLWVCGWDAVFSVGGRKVF
jgi:hypothetical protein